MKSDPKVPEAFLGFFIITYRFVLHLTFPILIQITQRKLKIIPNFIISSLPSIHEQKATPVFTSVIFTCLQGDSCIIQVINTKRIIQFPHCNFESQ